MATKPPEKTKENSIDLKHLNLKDVNFRRLIYVRRYLFVTVALGISMLLLILLAIYPQTMQIIETQKDIRAENEALRSLQIKIAGLRQVESLEEYSQRDKIDDALPFAKPLIPLLESSRRVSEESKARITAIETAPGRIGTGSAKVAQAITTQSPDDVVHGVDKMNVQITVQGSLDQISQFISLIESSTPVTNVTELQLKEAPAVTEDAPKEFEADMLLSSYYFTRAIEVAIDTPLPQTGIREMNFLQQLEQYTVTTPQILNSNVEGGGRQDLFGTGINALPIQ